LAKAKLAADALANLIKSEVKTEEVKPENQAQETQETGGS